jgi:hypothetical protein
VRVELSSSELVLGLLRALTAAGCLVQQLDATTCNVTPLDAEDADEAALELRFFVSAWAASRPGVRVTVLT